MNWRQALLLSSLTAFLLLVVVDGRRSIGKAARGPDSKEVADLKKRLFVQRLDASKFLKKQEKKSARSSEEFDDLTRSEESRYEYEINTHEVMREWDSSREQSEPGFYYPGKY